MKIDKTIYIHIGLHKTGSSALQEMLSLNATDLERDGTLYPDRVGLYPSHAELAWVLNPIRPHWSRLDDTPQNILSYYQDVVKKSTCERIILSSEDFSIFDYSSKALEKTKRIFKDKKTKFKVICYLRKPKDFIISLYRHAIYEGVYQGGIVDYISSELDFYAINYAERLKNWGNVFGRENIIIRMYDVESFPDKNIFNDFMAAIGAKPIPSVPPIKSNIGINPMLLGALTQANNLPDERLRIETRELLVRASVCLPSRPASELLFTKNENILMSTVERWMMERLEKDFHIKKNA